MAGIIYCQKQGKSNQLCEKYALFIITKHIYGVEFFYTFKTTPFFDK